MIVYSQGSLEPLALSYVHRLRPVNPSFLVPPCTHCNYVVKLEVPWSIDSLFNANAPSKSLCNSSSQSLLDMRMIVMQVIPASAVAIMQATETQMISRDKRDRGVVE